MKKAMLAAFLLIPVLTWGQATATPRVYVEGNDAISSAFAAGIQKKHVPVTLTTDAARSDYTVSLSGQNDKGSKARGITTAVFTGVYDSGAWDRVSMTVVDSKTSDVVFSYTCQKGGGRLQSVTECLAKHWKDQLEKSR